MWITLLSSTNCYVNKNRSVFMNDMRDTVNVYTRLDGGGDFLVLFPAVDLLYFCVKLVYYQFFCGQMELISSQRSDVKCRKVF